MDLPEAVYIDIRFRTVDISNPEEIYVHDNIYLTVISNGDKPSSFCDFTALEIDISTAMSGTRDYVI
jgi:hypothetical protein